MKLFYAFLMSHIIYVAAMHSWQNHEKARLNVLIRKSIKRVLGIPMNASTTRLMQLGVHNKLQEIIEAQHTSQVARLSTSPAGREIQAVLGSNPSLEEECKFSLTREPRASVTVSPLPGNMHPQHNAGRRRAKG